MTDWESSTNETGATWQSDRHFKPKADVSVNSSGTLVASAMWTAAATIANRLLAPHPPKVTRTSALNHLYSLGVSLEVKLLDDASSDHRPVLATLDVPGNISSTRTITRRDFKRVEPTSLCRALDSACQWDKLYSIHDVDDALAFVMHGINVALDVVAPMKSMTVKKDDDLYLTAGTVAMMKKRDVAMRSGDKDRYRHLRNRVTARVAKGCSQTVLVWPKQKATPESSGRLQMPLSARTLARTCRPSSTTSTRTARLRQTSRQQT